MLATTIERGNAIIEVHRPELSEADRRRNEKNIEIVLREFGKAVQRSEKKVKA